MCKPVYIGEREKCKFIFIVQLFLWYSPAMYLVECDIEKTGRETEKYIMTFFRWSLIVCIHFIAYKFLSLDAVDSIFSQFLYFRLVEN